VPADPVTLLLQTCPPAHRWPLHARSGDLGQEFGAVGHGPGCGVHAVQKASGPAKDLAGPLNSWRAEREHELLISRSGF
jgi:hypothetical protein